MPFPRTAVFCAALLTTVVGGCGSGTHASTAPTTSPPSSPVQSKAPGGFIGAIDAARVAAVCANARAAQTMQSGQVGGSAVSDPLVAAAGVLERPPVDPTAAKAAAEIRLELRRGHPGLAIATALAFCRSHGG